MEVMRSAIRKRLQALRVQRRAGPEEPEHVLACSHDRFDLERREQASNRKQRMDGSLLGW